MGQIQTILSTISPNNWMLLRRPRYRKYNRDHQPIESSIVHAGPTQSGPAADDSRKIRNSKPTCGCQRRTRPPSGAHHRACPIYEILNSTDLLRLQYVDVGYSGAADEGEMGVVCCKHRLAAKTAANCDPGTHAGWHRHITHHSLQQQIERVKLLH